MDTSKLEGEALNMAVTRANAAVIGVESYADYCGNWEYGGPIIERERIDLSNLGEFGWQAFVNPDSSEHWCLTPQEGQTPLIAAMRAFVASREK